MAYPSSTKTATRLDAGTQNFMNRAMAAKILSREEEQALARAWRDHRDEKSLHKLINAHGKLAIAAAQKFRHYGLPVADLAQEGQIGLLEAANRFDPDRDIRFATYAQWWVRSMIQDYILRNVSAVRLGSTAEQKSLFFNLRKLRAKIDAATHGQATRDDQHAVIADELSVSVGDVATMEQRLTGGDVSLNRPVGDADGTEAVALLRDERPNPEEILMMTKDAATRSRWLNNALAGLTEREQAIIRHRHLAERSTTLEELGVTLGVSKERVRQLETRAIEKLRTRLEGHDPFIPATANDPSWPGPRTGVTYQTR